MSGIVRLAAGIEAELARRSPRQRKTQRGKLALLVATMLSERSANLMDLAAAVPRPAERTDMRYQWIARLLADPRLDGDAVMQPFAEAAILHTGAAGGMVVLILDQSKVSARHQVLMLSVRVGERALPLAWRGRETRGSIGFVEQRELLTVVASWLPAGTRIVLMGDRFYGSPDLIALCRQLGWGWRLRLKQELLVFEGGGETTLAACFAGGQHMLSGIELTARRIVTNVAMVHEPGHPEPWLIALSEAPTVHRAFDYGLRWGIEAMFSDFKSRGFGLEDSQLRHPERLGRLLLVMALASSWRWPCIGPCPRACGTPRIGLCPPKKSLNAKAEQGGPRPNFPLQARPAPHPTSPSAPDPAPAPLERLAELMDGKLMPGRDLAL